MTATRRAGREALVLERVQEPAALRGEWSRLAEQAGNVFGTWEWADAWYRHLGAGAQLALGTVRRPEQGLTAILPLCVARERPLRLLRFIGAGPSDELGPLCAPADREEVADSLRQFVDGILGERGIFLGERLWSESGLGRQLGATTVHRAASPVLPTRGRSFEEFLASRSANFRGQVRRRERALARGHRLVYRLTADRDELERDMGTLIELHRARWGESSNAFAAARRDFHLEFARRALENGWLRLWTMELDSRPVAAWYGLRYAGIETYYQAGRDPALEKLNVGFVLLCHTIRCAFEDGMREYRFGLGGEPYKARFAEHDPGLETVAIAAGIRGRAALTAIRAGLSAPWRLKSLAWRLAAGQPETT